MLASAGTDLEITLIKVQSTGAQKQSRTLHGHTDRITGVSFTAASKQLLSASSDRTVKFWDTNTG